MKKLFAYLSGLMALPLFASPVLSPALPAVQTEGVFFNDACNWWAVRAGFRGDYVFNRYLGTDNIYSLFANEGILTVNFFDRIDVYGFVGGARQNLQTMVGGLVEDLIFESQTIWGIGIRAVLYKAHWGCCGTTFLGVDANYEGISDTNITTATLNGASSTVLATSRYREWQVSVQLGQQLKYLTPYIAIKGSSAHQTFPAEINNTSQRHVGYAVGASLVAAARVSVTAEARFVDEKAATIEAEFRF